SSINAQLVNEDYQLKDVLNWNRGSHSIKAGFEVFKKRYLNRGYFQTMRVFNFTGGITGNASVDYLLGKPATAQVAMPLTEQGGVQTQFNQFIQDDWRVNSRLTLNLGLRYDVALPWAHPQNYWAT